MSPFTRILSSAGDARLRVDDDARLEDARVHKGSQRQNGGRRITAGAGDQIRLSKLVSVMLRQSVRRVPIWRRVRIPLLPRCGVLQPKRAREIEDARAARSELRRNARGAGVAGRTWPPVRVWGLGPAAASVHYDEEGQTMPDRRLTIALALAAIADELACLPWDWPA